MDGLPVTQASGILEKAIQFFPVDLWGQIIVVAVAVLTVTQLIKIFFKALPFLPSPNPSQVILLAAVSAWPISFSVLKLMNDAISDWIVAVPVALAGGGVALFVATFALKFLYWWKPGLARALNCDPDRRFRNDGPARGQYERRRDRHV